jgi:pimeloyl-ACP methyl ester carboxylesterase
MTDLHHEARGTGPVLLVLPGGAGHPMGLDALAGRLAARFRVLTYDPLGLAHGRLGEPVADQRVTDWSEGADELLRRELPQGERAFVLGTSSGAVAALDLLARHPDRLRHVVAHEPPCVGVLPDGERHLTAFREVYETYRTAGLSAAGERLGAVLHDRVPDPPKVTQPLTREEELSNPMALFLVHVLRQFTSCAPDPAALQGHAGRLTLAAGADSRGLLLDRTARFTAERAGCGFAEFPGGHLGALEHPEAFADRLADVLTGQKVSWNS